MVELKPTTMLQKFNKFRKAITVEPVAILLMTGSMLAGTVTQTLMLEKTCRVNLNLSEPICDALRNQDSDDNAENERIVQEYVANLLAYRSIIIAIVPCFLMIFAGGWMDATGRRKAIMMLPVTGELLVQVNNIINVIFFYQLKVEVLIFVEAGLSSVSGYWSILFLAVFSYITDITTAKNRTFRLGLVAFCVHIGTPVGVAASGVLLKSFGYMTAYIVAVSMALINICYTIFFVADPVRTKKQKEHDNRGFFFFMKTFFNISNFINALKVVVKKTSDNRATFLCILLVATCFLFGPNYGEAAIMYMSTRYRFGWDELQYSLFQTYNMVLNTLGSMFSILFLIKKLKLHDSVLGILSMSSKILASFVYCFAATGGMFYLGPFIDMLNATASIAIRSIFSKSVEHHEIGKLNSVVGICEILMPLVYVPLYTQVYTASIEVLPGLVFLVGGALTIPPLLVFIWVLYRHLKSVKIEKNVVQDSQIVTTGEAQEGHKWNTRI